jgi:hypothetical protein
MLGHWKARFRRSFDQEKTQYSGGIMHHVASVERAFQWLSSRKQELKGVKLKKKKKIHVSC